MQLYIMNPALSISFLLCSQGLTYAEVRITNHQELMDEMFNGFLACSSQLGLNIGNY